MLIVSAAHKRLLVIAGLTLVYFLCGKLSLFLAIPPGYASVVWPAAGVALAAFLWFGSGCWPGIFLGSFLVNLGTDFVLTDLTSSLSSFLLPTGLAFGATLQAAFGAYLVRRLVGFPVAFNQIPQVGKIFILAVPFSCLVSATIGVTSLLMVGALPLESLPDNWLTWWGGDLLGVLIVLPPTLAWNHRLAHAGSRTLLTVLLPLFLALTLVVLLFFHVRSAEIEKERLLFMNRSGQLGLALRETLQDYLDVLHAIEGLYKASRQVERQEFADFVAHAFRRYSGLQALEWVPRVQRSERPAYEAAASRDGVEAFQIRELNTEQQLVPVAEREYYYPVYFIEPYRGNEKALGFDLGSNPERLAALTLARERGDAVASGRIKLVQEASEQFGILIVLPLYADGNVPVTKKQRQQHLNGYVLGVFRVEAMLKTVIDNYDHWGLSYRLHDRSAPHDEQLLAGSGILPGNPAGINPSFGTLLSNRVSFEYANRNWELSFAPTEQYFDQVQLTESRVVLIGGLLLVGLLGNVLLVAAGRNLLVRRLVDERTASLAGANEALLDSEAHQRAIVDNAVDGIVTIDEEGTILTYNLAAERLFGYLAEEVIGKNVNCLQPEPYHSQHDEYLRRYLQTGQARIIGIGREVSGRRKDGSVFPLELSVGEIRFNKRRQFIGILRDITERKQAEETMRQANEKLRQVDQLKSMFIASMSHELRTPLNAIIGFTSILREEWLGTLNDEQKENLAIVSRSGKHLLALINDVIDISKVEGDQLDVHSDVFDLYEVIEEAVNTLQAQAEVQKLELRIVNQHYQLRTDRLRFLQCLLNLLSNAIKYTEKGWIELSAEIVENEPRDEASLRITVTDTGIGISAEDQKSLFTPFIRLDSPLKSRIPGTGLGLYLCKKLACDVLQGSLECSSQPGVGSRFELTIPVCLEDA